MGVARSPPASARGGASGAPRARAAPHGSHHTRLRHIPCTTQIAHHCVASTYTTLAQHSLYH
eukprot:1839880-Pyramimonas_sp.AAC.1